jgi:predicted nucleic acid-binding protein
MTKVVIDSNLIFAAVRTKHNKVREVLDRDDLEFFAPNFLIVEIFKYKQLSSYF